MSGMSEESTPGSGRLTVSPIRFYCDLGRHDGLVIPLGQLGEITVGHARGLGMFARTTLTDSERTAIGQLGRQVLDEPFDYLSSLFDDAWDNAEPGRSLDYLVRRHSHSLNFGSPKEQAVPRRVMLGGIPIRAEVRNHLLGVLEEEMLEALGLAGTTPGAKPVPQNELWELAA